MAVRHPACSGSKWVRNSTRIAIYMRDGFTCIYCDRTPVDGIQLQLDHVICRFNGGTNSPRNLITSCRSCNSARKRLTVEEFAERLVCGSEDVTKYFRIVYRAYVNPMKSLPRDRARAALQVYGNVGQVLSAFVADQHRRRAP